MTNFDSIRDSLSIDQLVETDLPLLVEINEQGLPGTGKVNQQEMQNLLELSELSLGVFADKKLLGLLSVCYQKLHTVA